VLLRRDWPAIKVKDLPVVLALSLQAVLPLAAAQLDSQWFIPANQGRVIAMDGNLQTFLGEWNDASWIRFDQSPYPPQRATQPPGPDLYTIYAKTYSGLLYVAWNLSESDPVQGSIEIFIDPKYDRSSAPQPGHYRLHIERSGGATVYRGTGSGWEVGAGAPWIHAERNLPWRWQGEIEIPLSDLRTGVQGPHPMGIAFQVAGAGTGFWPSNPSFNSLAPNTWGTLVFPTYATVTTTVSTTIISSQVDTSIQTFTTAVDIVSTSVSTVLHSTTQRRVLSETLTEMMATSETKSVITTSTSTQTITRTVQIVLVSKMVIEQQLAGVPSWILLVGALLGSLTLLVYALIRGESRSSAAG